MSKLLEKAIAEINKLPVERQDELAAWILKTLASDEGIPDDDWETEVLIDTLGDALRPDGSIDFDRLRTSGSTLTLGELYPEGDNGEGK